MVVLFKRIQSHEVDLKSAFLLPFCLHHSQVSDLNSQLHISVDKVRLEREELMDQLHHLSAENASTKLDNQRLKVGESRSFSCIQMNYFLEPSKMCLPLKANHRYE